MCMCLLSICVFVHLSVALAGGCVSCDGFCVVQVSCDRSDAVHRFCAADSTEGPVNCRDWSESSGHLSCVCAVEHCKQSQTALVSFANKFCHQEAILNSTPPISSQGTGTSTKRRTTTSTSTSTSTSSTSTTKATTTTTKAKTTTTTTKKPTTTTSEEQTTQSSTQAPKRTTTESDHTTTTIIIVMVILSILLIAVASVLVWYFAIWRPKQKAAKRQKFSDVKSDLSMMPPPPSEKPAVSDSYKMTGGTACTFSSEYTGSIDVPVKFKNPIKSTATAIEEGRGVSIHTSQVQVKTISGSD